jgi:hypothetical protein
MSEGPESRFARGVGAAPPGPGLGPHPTRTEVAAALYVLAAEKGESLRSATTPTKGDRRLISLPVEQQLLELKPNDSKMATLAPRPRRAAGRVVLGWLVHPPGSRCRCAARPSRGGEGPWSGECHIPPVAHPSPCSETQCMQNQRQFVPRAQTSFSTCVDLVPVGIDG